MKSFFSSVFKSIVLTLNKMRLKIWFIWLQAEIHMPHTYIRYSISTFHRRPFIYHDYFGIYFDPNPDHSICINSQFERLSTRLFFIRFISNQRMQWLETQIFKLLSDSVIYFTWKQFESSFTSYLSHIKKEKQKWTVNKHAIKMFEFWFLVMQTINFIIIQVLNG